MSLSANKITSFTFLHQAQPDRPNTVFPSSAAFKAAIDTQAQQCQTAINQTIDDLTSIVLGTSGGEQVGSAPIFGVAGTNVRAQIADIFAQLQAVVVSGSLPNGTVSFAKLTADQQTASVGGILYANANLGGW